MIVPSFFNADFYPVILLARLVHGFEISERSSIQQIGLRKLPGGEGN